MISFVVHRERDWVLVVWQAAPIAVAAGLVAWWQRELTWVGVVGLYGGIAIGWTIYAVTDSSSASHELFPFEVIVICVAATVPMGFGALAGQALRAWRTRSLQVSARQRDEQKQ